MLPLPFNFHAVAAHNAPF